MNIFNDGILIDITVSFWSGAKTLTPEDLGLKEIPTVFHLGKKYLIDEAVLKSFRAIESRARHLVGSNSFKFPIGSARFIPKKKFGKVIEALKVLQTEYMALVESLIANYDTYRGEMTPKYIEAAKTAFAQSTEDNHGMTEIEFINIFMDRISKFYPPAESLRDRYGLVWDVYEIALPKMVKADAEAIVEKQMAQDEYQVQMKQKMGSFIDSVVSTLRGQTLELCNRITQNITEGKVIKGKTLNSLREFIDKFSELNFVGDNKVEGQLEALKRDFLDVHTTKTISDDMELQTELKTRLIRMAEVVADQTDINIITGGYKRKINW